MNIHSILSWRLRSWFQLLAPPRPSGKFGLLLVSLGHSWSIIFGASVEAPTLGSSDHHPMGRSLFRFSKFQRRMRMRTSYFPLGSSCLAFREDVEICWALAWLCPSVERLPKSCRYSHGISWDQWCQPTWFLLGGSPLWQWATDDQLLNLWIYPGSSCQMAEFIAPMSSAHEEEWNSRRCMAMENPELAGI